MNKDNMLRGILAVTPALFIFLLAVSTVQAAEPADAANETSDEPVTIWGIGKWFFSTTGYFMSNISEKGEQWFGIDQSIMVLFLLIIFLLAIRYKANGWMFWFLIIIILFFVATGMIPLGDWL